MNKLKKSFMFLISILFLSLLYISCSDWFTHTGSLAIEYTGEILNLSWNDEPDYIDTRYAVDYYNLYYRSLGKLEWEALDSTASDNTMIAVFRRDIGYGCFEFAIEAIYKNGRKSGIHSSADFSAWPAGGWYIDWHE